MSQIYKSSSSGPIPPTIPTQFTTDNGSIATPAANNINVYTPGNGTQGIATSASGSTITITLTDTTLTGTAQTTNNSTANINVNIPVSTSNSVVNIRANIAGYAKSSGIAVGGELIGAVRNVGGTLTVITETDLTKNNDTALSGWSATLTTSGTNALVQVQGVNTYTINWTAIIDYVTATEAQA